VSRLGALGRAVASAFVLAALLVAVPMGLVAAVGWPLPGELPPADELLRIVGERSLSDAFIIKALAVVIWLAWAQLVACVVIELVASVRVRPPGRVPLGGLLQPLAGWLVASLFLAASIAGSRTAVAAPLAAVLAHAEALPTTAAPPTTPTTTAPVAEDPPADRYVVVPGDNLWDIAEECVERSPALVGELSGAPGRNVAVSKLVGEIFDLNRGKEQPDGRWLRKPDLIRPGWILELPDGAHVQVAPKVPGAAVEPTPSPPPSALATVTTAVPAISTPGPVATPEPTAPPVATGATTPTLAPPTAVTGPTSHTGRGAPSSLTTGMLGGAAAALAVGLGTTLRRRRRLALSRARTGATLDPAPAEFDDLRATIAIEDDKDHLGRVALALREVGAHLVGIGSLARPRLVQADRQRIEVLLSASALPAPAGWRPEASGSIWARSRPAAGDDLWCPAPALVTLGSADGAVLYLDLETEGSVAVAGDGAAVTDFGRSLVLELAHSVLAETLALVLVGDLDGLPAGLDRLEHAASWAEVLDAVTAWAQQSGQALAANRWPSGLHARAAGPANDAVAPLVVIATTPPTADEMEILAGLPVPSTVTIVALGWEPHVATRVELDGSLLRIPALGVVCEAQRVDGGTSQAVGDLLDHAARPAQLSLLGPERPSEEAGDIRNGDRYVDPEYEVIVRVLGDIEVVGGRRPLTPLQAAVVAYIAVHSPVAAGRVEDAVWTTPTANRHKRLANTVSDARAALGAHHFPVATDGRYSVGTGVITDLQLLERRVTYAATQSEAAAAETLRGGLELVRGPAFSYRNADRASFVWVDLENWSVRAELVVTDAAVSLGEICLAVNDSEGAAWAATRGLLASPAHTLLTELLMRAHALAGDGHASDRVYENHVNVLQALDLDEVAESTLDLHAKLSQGTRVAG
jgi:hypothetical protein